MLPQQHRLHRSADFSSVVRGGRRIGRRTIVLHILQVTDEADVPTARSGGPRVGLVVSKAVGNAVTRHAVSRKLRHVAADVIAGVPDDVDIVIRALPASGTATSLELVKDVRSAVRKFLR
ncbi:ribonuclease P protein component [Corynebacterium sputi]|uniref:ribonuclease P protein component n=1 Tax=Corynebacterium sputi TaxID=489915 RepID=UPI00047E13BC|nr:ribonuclease P protein component [Corynebacterium sputi]